MMSPSLTRVYLGRTVVTLGCLWLLHPGVLLVAAVVVTVAVAAGFWWWRSPGSFTRCVAGPVRSRLWRARIRAAWPQLARACDLGREELPRIRRARRDWPRLELVVRPLPGQTYTAFEHAAEALRMGVGASQIRVEPTGIRDVCLTFTIGDALSRPFDAWVPEIADLQLGSVVTGRRSDGEAWRLPVGPHTLVAGCSGSGKGSVFWSFAFGLAPAVHDGRVQLHGIDLKGGMEILMGEPLFTTLATSPAEAVAALERLVEQMRIRTLAYAGRVRTHVPSVEEPLHVVMVDELAALTAYCSDRELQRRAETAVNLLCSQGRAPGFMVFACLQDPRKEVIPSRGLFTQMVGLRLKDLSETTMVLGEVVVASGAHCHRITRGVPGTGYVIPEDGDHPIRVRAGYASDEAIREVAHRYATPIRIPIDANGVEQDLALSRERRSRSIEARS